MTDPHALDIPNLARTAFEAYAASTGGKTHDGRPIPSFDEVCAKSPHVAAAWEAAVRAVLARAVARHDGSTTLAEFVAANADRLGIELPVAR